MTRTSKDDLVDIPGLNEPCPCKNAKKFGECCGRDFDCDCHSHLPASDCCYVANLSPKELPKKSPR